MSTESPMPERPGPLANPAHPSADGNRFTPVLQQVGGENATWMLPSFADPVAGSQAAFRSALNALAHPGRVHTLPDVARITAPAPLSPAMAALLLTLADSDTLVWLAPEFGDTVRRFLRFHNGCTVTDHPEQAAFAVLSCTATTHAAGPWPALQRFAQGDLANPHGSTTLLIETPHLADPTRAANGDAAAPATSIETVTLHGPGIAATQALDVGGLPSDFWAQWRTNRTHFPQGVDVFLINGVTFCGLPRTTQRES